MDEKVHDHLHCGPFAHVAMEGSLEELFSKEMAKKIMKSEKYCSYLTCLCCKTKSSLEGSIFRIMDIDSTKTCCGKVCICDQSKPDNHIHGDCSHHTVYHQDHWDYLVRGELHHQVDGLCFIHGQLAVERTLDDLESPWESDI